MKKEYKRAYMFAAILSIILYIFGIYTGIILQKNTEASIERKLNEIEKSIENTQLEYLYINSLGEKISCESLKTLVDETNKNLWNIGQELVNLESNSNDKKFLDLKGQYTILSVRAWILNNYLKNKCKDDNIILLYFYSIPCKDCEKQGKILDDIRENEFKNKIKIFVLDAGLNLPIVNTLKKSYNVNTTPFIVFENKTFEGFIEKNQLLNELTN